MTSTEPPLGVVFDAGGTLVWSTDDHFETAGAWAVANELRSTTGLTDLDGFAGALLGLRRHLPAEGARHRQINSLREVLATVLRAFEQPAGPHEVEALERCFIAPALVGMRGIPGAVGVVRRLRGRVRLGLMSNTRSHALIAGLMEAIGLADAFDPLVTSAGAGVRKPAAEAFAPLVEAWGVPPERLVMIGNDLSKDVAGAARAGMRTIWWRASPDEARGWGAADGRAEFANGEGRPRAPRAGGEGLDVARSEAHGRAVAAGTAAAGDAPGAATRRGPDERPPEPDAIADEPEQILQALRSWGVDLDGPPR